MPPALMEQGENEVQQDQVMGVDALVAEDQKIQDIATAKGNRYNCLSSRITVIQELLNEESWGGGDQKLRGASTGYQEVYNEDSSLHIVKFLLPSSQAPHPRGRSSLESAGNLRVLLHLSLCIVNLSLNDSENAQREKKLPNEITCCCINNVTSTLEYLEILVGCETGEILLVDGINLSIISKYNTGGNLNNSRVMDVKWVPDKSMAAANASTPTSDSSSSNLDSSTFSVSKPKTNKNPISRWHVAKGPVNYISFSAENTMCLCCHDGNARIFHYPTEKLIFSLRSQYGAILCCAWSPDGSFLITGGEDDVVVVWSLVEKCAVARCLGHNSWISSVQFDPAFCSSSSNREGGPASNYRFLSIAQDGRLCFWDLNEGNLIISRKRQGAPRKSTSFMIEKMAARAVSNTAETFLTFLTEEVASMEPISNTLIAAEPLASMHVTQEGIITVSYSGELKLWNRPSTGPPSNVSEDD
ncbi:hypothetical protein GUITHDRAFT_143825 [Guillardia theta CCMP2712]|uniref:Uncharacterized protein n=1 Tax=Guillardia theta (strain CCMP2712) TaxID=905079 RepID=L1ISE4_GUITC|nr:hypothetical protein GUITHDRAFT_143825 [Guillardia theta CCMP2712]EKX39022.1 hypothetical protein GUITHDRAFT_143825 [Guillardia theta CCMP2712]|eukprot:XP_005826002.1 hypothetical protein GUITHDRAFT_143825 [Guillardia theta CCMP2712]